MLRFLTSITLTQPPFQNADEPAEDDDQQQIDTGHAYQREHLLIGSAVDGLGSIDQLLAADDGDEGGVLQQNDELVAQGGKNGLEGLGDDDKAHGIDVAETQAAACLRLTGIQGHEAAPDDLGHVGAGVDAQGQGADHGVAAAGAENDEAHNQQLHHHGSAPDDGDIDLGDEIQRSQKGIAEQNLLVRGNLTLHFGQQNLDALGIAQQIGTLLVVGGADHSHQDTQRDADGKGQGGDQKGGAYTVQILPPAVAFDEGFVKVYIKLCLFLSCHFQIR